jgi:hypothetical protein
MENQPPANENVIAEQPQPPKRTVPKWLLIGGPIGVVVLMFLAFLIFVPSAEDTYLERLSEEGLGGLYASDAQAIAAGQAECRRLNEGGDPQGTQEKFVAVEIFCDDFALGYKILKEIYVEGSITVYDSDVRGSDDCYVSDGGYDDIQEGLELVILNGKGDRLTTTALESGEDGISFVWCTFPFSFTVLEGEEEYIVDFGRRGDFSYSETELKEPESISLTIGL